MQLLYLAFATVILWLTWPDLDADNWKRMIANGVFCASLASLIAIVWVPTIARWLALLALSPVFLVLLGQGVDRIAFIAAHGAMDCFDCNGSPMAFLIGWVMETVLLVPAATLVVWLVKGKSQFRR
ncbi:MAG: hypothetical protein JNM76_10480 [Betaproteobacteria bacterium]|nr:hypothetical protein [Betaproteobacteria bacterium]